MREKLKSIQGERERQEGEGVREGRVRIEKITDEIQGEKSDVNRTRESMK